MGPQSHSYSCSFLHMTGKARSEMVVAAAATRKTAAAAVQMRGIAEVVAAAARKTATADVPRRGTAEVVAAAARKTAAATVAAAVLMGESRSVVFGCCSLSMQTPHRRRRRRR